MSLVVLTIWLSHVYETRNGKWAVQIEKLEFLTFCQLGFRQLSARKSFLAESMCHKIRQNKHSLVAVYSGFTEKYWAMQSIIFNMPVTRLLDQRDNHHVNLYSWLVNKSGGFWQGVTDVNKELVDSPESFGAALKAATEEFRFSSGRFHRLSGEGAACLLVLGQQWDPGEGLEAACTLVLFHFRVGLEVSSQVGSVSESSAAVEARERFLSWRRNTEIEVSHNDCISCMYTKHPP